MTMNSAADGREAGSFRDNRGYIFWHEGEVHRRVERVAAEAYDKMMEDGGLYEALAKRGLIVTHEELDAAGFDGGAHKDAHRVLRAERVPVISYPYEWSFSQLQDAALTTLRIQRMALRRGMTLRDASAYNIQWVAGRPVLIDTLSFDVAREGEPWVAYRQFCQHFLAPLALMAHCDLALQKLLMANIDGVPLGVAAATLPVKAKVRPGLFTHIVLHARFQKQHQSSAKRAAVKVSKDSVLALLDSLDRTVRGLRLPGVKTEWGEYYENTNYNDKSFKVKKTLVEEYLKYAGAKTVVDLGANDGSFSRVAASTGARVVACDIDPMAVESNYRQIRAAVKKAGTEAVAADAAILPMLIDLTNPSPALGWANTERAEFTGRARSDAAMALALVHHLAISNNLPLGHIAGYFAQIAPHLVIEFVPKSDSQVKILLATREDIFDNYNEEGFEKAFSEYYQLVRKAPVDGSKRTLYLFKRK